MGINRKEFIQFMSYINPFLTGKAMWSHFFASHCGVNIRTLVVPKTCFNEILKCLFQNFYKLIKSVFMFLISISESWQLTAQTVAKQSPESEGLIWWILFFCTQDVSLWASIRDKRYKLCAVCYALPDYVIYIIKIFNLT